jgi:hypothetical protein
MVGVVSALAAIVVAACVDLSAPKGSPASISQIQLGAFFVVQGDTLRDTLGAPVPPSIIAYDGAGGVLTSFTPTFFLTDTSQSLHFNPDGTLSATGTADTAGATAHLLGQIGRLQTAPQTIYVTVRPDALERSTTSAVLDSIIPVAGDDSASSIATVRLSAVVHGVGGRPVPGVFVRYELRSNIASNSPNALAVYLRDDSNKAFGFAQSTPDTGDVSGVTSRTLVVNSKAVADRTILTTDDTLSVVATALYRGNPLVGSPLTIRVVLKCVPGACTTVP